MKRRSLFPPSPPSLPPFQVLLTEALTTKVAEAHFHKEAIDDLKYSPDGSKLATASHDNFIDVFDVHRGCDIGGMSVCRAPCAEDTLA